MRLCDRDIEAWLDEGRLSITPRPPIERINGVTVDVRLGNKFRTFSGHTAPFIDLSGPKDEVSAALDRVMSDEIVIDEGEAFYLHPGELALAVTFESVTLPADLEGGGGVAMVTLWRRRERRPRPYLAADPVPAFRWAGGTTLLLPGEGTASAADASGGGIRSPCHINRTAPSGPLGGEPRTLLPWSPRGPRSEFTLSGSV